MIYLCNIWQETSNRLPTAQRLAIQRPESWKSRYLSRDETGHNFSSNGLSHWQDFMLGLVSNLTSKWSRTKVKRRFFLTNQDAVIGSIMFYVPRCKLLPFWFCWGWCEDSCSPAMIWVSGSESQRTATVIKCEKNASVTQLSVFISDNWSLHEKIQVLWGSLHVKKNVAIC